MKTYYFEDLKNDIKKMSRQSKLYKLLKEELSRKGYWKNQPRGNPKYGYEVSQKHKEPEF